MNIYDVKLKIRPNIAIGASRFIIVPYLGRDHPRKFRRFPQ